MAHARSSPDFISLTARSIPTSIVAGHDAVPDVQFLDAGDAHDRLHVPVVQPVAHVDVQPQCDSVGRRAIRSFSTSR